MSLLFNILRFFSFNCMKNYLYPWYLFSWGEIVEMKRKCKLNLSYFTVLCLGTQCLPPNWAYTLYIYGLTEDYQQGVNLWLLQWRKAKVIRIQLDIEPRKKKKKSLGILLICFINTSYGCIHSICMWKCNKVNGLPKNIHELCQKIFSSFILGVLKLITYHNFTYKYIYFAVCLCSIYGCHSVRCA